MDAPAGPALVAERIRVALDVCRWMGVSGHAEDGMLNTECENKIRAQVAEPHRKMAIEVLAALAGYEAWPTLKTVELVLGKMLAAMEQVGGASRSVGEFVGERFAGAFPAEHEDAVRAVLKALDGSLGGLEVNVAEHWQERETRRVVTTRWTAGGGIEPPRHKGTKEKHKGD